MTEAEKLEDIKRRLDDILQSKKTIRALDAAELRAYEEQVKVLNKGTISAGALEQKLKDIQKQVAENERAIYGISGAFNEAVDELNGMNAGLNRAKKAFRGLESIADKLANDQSDIARMSLKDLKSVEEKVKKREAELKIAQKSLQFRAQNIDQTKKLSANEQKIINALNSVNAELSNEGNLRQDLIKQAQQRIQAEETIIKTMGMAPAILEGIGKALQKIGLPDFGVTEAVQNTKDIIRLKNEEFSLNKQIKIEQAEKNIIEIQGRKNSKKKTKDLKDQKSLLKKLKKTEAERISSMGALSILIGEVGKKLKAQFTTANLIQGSITLLVAAMMQLDSLSGKLAKNIGISYDESLAMQKNFNQIALNSDNIMVSTSNLNAAFASLNQRFQGATGFSNEMLESFTALTKQAGFSEESVSNLAVVTGTQGKELESNLALMQGQLTVMNAQNKTSFSEKQLLEGIGKISKATLLTLRNQPKALTRTLITSAKLVLSFQEMESIASSLLDFEGSIGAELEAELLTGKQINLESARLLALKGDIAGAAAEVAKEVGSAAEFERMNVIQQEALAKAAGLTREQLANSLMEREALAKLGGQDATALEAYNRLKKQGLSDEAIANRLGDDRLAAQLKSQSVQERFAASVERLKEIFVDVGTTLMPIISGIADMVVGISKFVSKFSFILKPLMIVYGLFKGIQLVTTGINKGLAAMAGIKKNILKFSKGEFAFQKKTLLQHKLANVLKRLGLITDEQSRMAKARATILDRRSVLTQKESNLYANAGLGTQLRINIQKRLGNLQEAISKQFSKEGLFYKGAILAKELAIKSAQLVNNNLTAIGLGFNKENLIVKGLIYAKDIAINAAEKIGKALKAGALALSISAGIAEQTILSSKLAQNSMMGGLISKGLAYLSVLVAQAAAAIAGASAITLGIGFAIIAAATAAGIAYLYSKTKPKKVGDASGDAGGITFHSEKMGMFEGKPGDQFVMAPGIADAAKSVNDSKRKSNTSPTNNQAQQNNNTVLEQSMNKTNKILQTVANQLKPKPLLGSEIGNAVSTAEYEIQ
jgi:hypothetical protein